MKHFNFLKKTYWLLIVVLFYGGNAWGQATDLFISEYGEGSSNNKWVEIYNGTGAAVNLANYEIWRVSNGGTWAEATLSLSGTLADGDVYVIYNPSSVAGITTNGDLSSGVISHNGDDAVGLAKSGVLIDAVGTDGADPGTGWDVAGTTNATANHTLVRKSTVCSPNTNWTTSAGTNTTDSEWIVSAQDDFSDIGSHTASCASATPTVGFDNLTSSDNEGNTISIPVTLTNGSTFPVTLNVAATDLTTEGGDYTLNTTTITFNSDGTQNVSIDFNQDADFDDEMLTLTLTEATATGVTISQDTNNVTILDDDVAPTFSFTVASGSQVEGNSGTTTYDIDVTISATANASVDVVVTGGTATNGGDDYTFTTPTTLNFTNGGATTQTVSVTIVGDTICESSETVIFALQNAVSAAIGGITTHTLTITQDDATWCNTSSLAAGLIINEFSNGASGTQEYTELLVTGTPGSVVDIRGWVIDDNNGIFSGGVASGMGIAAGHLRFKDDCAWENIPVGSLIVIYHDGEKNTEIGADDPTDSDGDYVYILSAADPIMEGNADASLIPSTADSNYTNATTWAAGAGAGAQIGLSNSQDGIQVRAPQTSNYGFVHGLSYGFTDADHPDFSEVGVSISAALHWTGGGGSTVWSFTHDTDDDYKDKDNWTSTTANATTQTPGDFNNAANQVYIESLRTPYLPIETAADTDVCTIDAGETKTFYSNGDSDVLGKVTNNNGSDYGNTTLSTFLAAGTNGVYTRNFGSGDYYFFERYYTLSVTSVPGTPNYDTRFYYTTAELTAFTNEINALTGSSYTIATILPTLRIYKTASTTTVETAAAAGDFEIQTPTFGVQSPQSYAYWEYSGWTGFSGFALGTHITLLPVEWLNFEGEKVGNSSLLKWTTENEVNNNGFYVMRSTNGVDYKSLGFVDAQSKNSSKSVYDYQFIDESLPKGVIYYQLKQVDLDGEEHFSNVIEIDNSESVLELMTIAPNPSKDFFRIETFNSVNVDVTVNIMSIEGKFYGKFTGDVNAASDFLKNTSSKLSTGLYIVTLETENDVKHFKVSKY